MTPSGFIFGYHGCDEGAELQHQNHLQIRVRNPRSITGYFLPQAEEVMQSSAVRCSEKTANDTVPNLKSGRWIRLPTGKPVQKATRKLHVSDSLLYSWHAGSAVRKRPPS